MQSVRVEDYYKAVTSVWWDTDSCCVPHDCNPCWVIDNIKLALQHLNYQGKITIYIYGSSPVFHEEALAKNDVYYLSIGGKKTINKNIICDMSFWAVFNEKPSNILLISENPEFSDLIHQLRHRKYNILLALPEILKSPSLVLAASTIWPWSKLLCGEPPNVVKPITCLPGFEKKENAQVRRGPKIWKEEEKGETSGS